MDIVWILLAAAGIAFLAWRGLRVWQDAGRVLAVRPGQRLRWALLGAVIPSAYWWAARIEALPAPERRALLERETRALGLLRAGSARCPLCGTEIPGAWTVAGRGRRRSVTVGPGPVQCPGCDFRLDACRHCAHFLPGGPQSWAASTWSVTDNTWGRCGFYKRAQPVEDAVAPDMARTLRARGYDQIQAPAPIADSLLRPDYCRAFQPDPRRLRASGLRISARQAALLRLLAGEPDWVGSRGSGETNENDQHL